MKRNELIEYNILKLGAKCIERFYQNNIQNNM